MLRLRKDTKNSQNCGDSLAVAGKK